MNESLYSKTSAAKSRRNPLQVQWAVIHALFVRNLSVQFGRLRGGLAWAFVEPLLQVAFFTTLYYLKGRKELNNIPIPMLVITGVVPFILFRQITSGGAKALRQATPLFNYRLVQPIDPILAHTLHHTVFFVFTLTSLVMFCHIYHFYFEQILILELITNIGLMILFSLGLSLNFAVLIIMLPEARKIVPFFIRPLFFVSGIFFTAESISSDLRPYFLYNPLLHVTEITRSCFYYSYPSHGSLSYVAGCSILSLTFGFITFHLNRSNLLEG